MELDLLVAGKAASKQEELDDQALPAIRSTSWGDGASCWVIVWGCWRAMLPRRVGHAWSRLEPARGGVVLRGPAPERALRVAASAVGGGTRVRIRRQDQPQQAGGHRSASRPAKNSLMSRASRSGASAGAKWPPRGIGVQRRTSYSRAAHSRGGLPSETSSLANTATAVGTVTKSSGPMVGPYRRLS